MMARAAAPAFLILLSLACGPANEEPCLREITDVQPDERVQGYVPRELLERYFGRYDGTLTWDDGDTTSYSLELPYVPDDPYQMYNIFACKARNVLYHSPASVTTGDGAFDTEIIVTVSARFPDAAPTHAPDSAANFSGLPDWAWTETVRARVPVDVSRYSSAILLFELEWPPEDAAPASGRLDFYGTLESAPNLADTLQIATIAF